MAQGIATALFGKTLFSHVTGEPRLAGWSVFYDHGNRKVDANV
jgi:hypothetical protein